jgi:hypothetical protein
MRRTVKYVLLLSGVVLLGIAAFMGLLALPLKSQQTSATSGASHPYNIIFIISDQEADHLLATGDYKLPARDELKRRGSTSETTTSHLPCARRREPPSSVVNRPR